MSNGMILTKKGREVLILALAGAELHFTRGAIGDGQAPEGDLSEITALVHEAKSLAIQDINVTETGTCEVILKVTNEGRNSGLWLREYGLFATHPTTGDEILYAYCNKGDESGYLEGYDGANPVTFDLRLVTVVDQAGNITVVFDSMSIERLAKRVTTLEQAMAGLTPPMVIDAIRELQAKTTWDTEPDDIPYEEMTPEEVADKLRHLRELMTWAA